MFESSLIPRTVAEAHDTSKSHHLFVVETVQQTNNARECHIGPTRSTQPIHDYLKFFALRNHNITATDLVIRLYNTHDVLI